MVVNLENDGGIYIVDIVIESGKVTCVKVIYNGMGVCSRVYSFVVSDVGDIFFIDVDVRKIGKFVEGNIVEYIIGLEGEIFYDGCDKIAVFV